MVLTVLTRQEENSILTKMLEDAKKGIRTNQNDIINSVIKIVQADNRKTPFNKGRPGIKWMMLFKRRNQQVFAKYRKIIGKNDDSDSDSDSHPTPKKKRRTRNNKRTVSPPSSPQHSDKGNPSHQSDDVSQDEESEKSHSEEEIDDKQFITGTLLEVMDFNGQWYPVKVLEVDNEEKEVLVHYQKWSDRYDEWVRMDSNRIRRPSQASSNLRHNFKVGEKVMATWSYSLKFPAVVQAVHDDDKVDVLFYDGFAKTLRSCKLAKANEEDLKNMSAPRVYKVAPRVGSDPVEHNLCSKEERRERKRKINILEVLHPHLNKRKKIAESKEVENTQQKPCASKPTAKISLRKSSGDNSRARKESITIKVEKKIKETSSEEETNNSSSSANTTMEDKCEEKDDESVSNKESPVAEERADSDPDQKDTKLLANKETVVKRRRRRRKWKKELPLQKRRPTDEQDPRWDTAIPHGATPVKYSTRDGHARESIIIPDKRLPDGWTKHTMLRRNSSKWDVFLVNSEGRKFRSRNELRMYYSEINEPYPEDQFDFVVGRKQQLIEDNKKEKKLDGESEPKLKKTRKRRRRRQKFISESHASDNNDSDQDKSESSPVVPKLKIKLPFKTPSSANTPVAPVPVDIKRIKTLLPKGKGAESESKPSTPMPTESPSPLLLPEPNISLVQTSANVSPSSQDGFPCPIAGCGKNFRKESLLQMHIKHYHPEYSNLMGSTPNVADLAYARTTGEPLEDSRAEMTLAGGSFIDRINKFEAERKARTSEGPYYAGSSKKHRKESPAPKTPERDETDSPVTNSKPETKIETEVSSSGDSTAVNSQVSPKSLSTTHQDEQASDPVLPDVPSLECSPEQSPTSKATPAKEEKSTIKTLLPQRQAAEPASDMMELVLKENSDDEEESSSNVLQTLHNENSASVPKKTKDEPNQDEEADDNKETLTSATTIATSYRFARQRTPLITLEKLAVNPDSNGRVDLSASNLDEKDKIKDTSADQKAEFEGVIEPLRKDEIINCTCGYMEEDGLMIQCDLCLCWQHGLCNQINKESEVPEKYVCYICQHPARQRKSSRFSHNQDWIREGKLPSLSFRTKNNEELQNRTSMLKKSHDLASNVLQLQSVIQSLRVKTTIAQKPDHPKLYLWAKSWKKDSDDSKKELTNEMQSSIEKKDVLGRVPEPEAAIDMEDCQLRLLEHIEDFQHQLESRLTSLQAQVAALESEDPDLASDEGPEFYPVTKQTVQMILRDLKTMQKIATVN